MHDRREKDEQEKQRQKVLKTMRYTDVEEPDDDCRRVEWRIQGKNKITILRCPITLTVNDLLAIIKEAHRG